MSLSDNCSASFGHFCRLCVENITEQTEPNVSIDVMYERILECTGVRLRRSVGIPENICDECSSKLAMCESFIKQCREADQKFLELRTLLNTEQNRVAESEPLEAMVILLNDAGSKNEESHVAEIVDTHLDYETDLPGEEHLATQEIQNRLVENDKMPKKKITKGRKKTQCPVCGIMQQNLKQHMLVHTGEKRHTCPFCNKAFAQKGNLTLHVNQHTRKRSYKCDQCDKAFSDPGLLRSHKLMHTDERMHRCEICGDTFKYKTSLAVHLRGHNQDRRFACSECGSTFISSSNFKKHFRIHTGERPYACSVCDKTFRSGSNLSAHKLSHTKERRFQCDICYTWFSYKHVMKVHMKIHLRQRNVTTDRREQRRQSGDSEG